MDSVVLHSPEVDLDFWNREFGNMAEDLQGRERVDDFDMQRS
jgi:hypothetical protein